MKKLPIGNHYQPHHFNQITNIMDKKLKAFPLNNGSAQYGMDLRDYFAGQAIIGIYSANEDRATMDRPDSWAETAYEIADAMMKERIKSK